MREFAKYTLLNVIAMISLSCYILADTFFISWQLGAYGLAALNFAVPVFGIVFGVGMMLGIGGATKYAILKSQNDNVAANKVFTNTAIITAVFAVIFTICGVLFVNFIARAFGASGEVLKMTRAYLRVILLFSPVFLVGNMLICFTRNDGSPKLAMVAMLCSSLLNIAFDYLFIVMLDMGMFGAALATGLAHTIGLMVISSYVISGRNGFSLARIAVSWKVVRNIFATGMPLFISEVSISVVMIVFNIIMFGLEGNIGVAAFGVIANILIVIVSIYNGIAQGVQPLISKYHGAQNSAMVRRILRYALVLVAGASIAIYAGVFFGANWIAEIFNAEQNALLQSLAVSGMRVYFAGIIFAGFNIVMAIYFTSTENPRPAHVISVLRGFVVILPLVFVLAQLGGVAGVWFAFPVAELVVSGVAYAIILFSRRRFHEK